MHISESERARHEICVNVTTLIKYLLPGSATTNTGVLRPETLGSATLLLAVFVTLASWPVTSTLAIARRPARGGRSSWTDCLFMCGRDNFSWEVQPDRTHQFQTPLVLIIETGIPFSEVFDTFRSDGVVVVLPRELGLDETLRCQTLEGFDDFEIWNVEIFVFWEIEVLFGNQYTLCSEPSASECPAGMRSDRAKRRTLEEVFVDDTTVLF